jgi:hypothetical protein
MDNPTIIQWNQWESRMKEWLSQSDNNLTLNDTTPLDRVMLTVLAVKYQVSYEDIGKLEHGQHQEPWGSGENGKPDSETLQVIPIDKQERRNKSDIKLSKTKLVKEEKKTDHLDQEKARRQLFCGWTGHLLTPEDASNETSSEWEEFIQLYDWHGLEFLKRFNTCLRRLVTEYVVITPAYQQLISKPALISPVRKIDNRVYFPKNDGQIYLSVDIKAAAFSLLQHIQAIDAQTYPSWADFLSTFVGSRPLLLQSKRIRLRCLGTLPDYYKLEALWTHFTGTIYKTILSPCLAEMNVDAVCVAVAGDEVVFHLGSIDQEKVVNLVHHVKQKLNEIPIVTFLVQAYRLRMFRWKDQHTCFARVFISQSEQSFDLKCVPNKDQNYDQAYKDCQMFLGL